MAKNLKTPSGDELPPAYVDGWFGHKHGLPRNKNPYNLKTQHASYELWTEGYTTRKYLERNNQDLSLDDYVPRVAL